MKNTKKLILILYSFSKLFFIYCILDNMATSDDYDDYIIMIMTMIIVIIRMIGVGMTMIMVITIRMVMIK